MNAIKRPAPKRPGPVNRADGVTQHQKHVDGDQPAPALSGRTALLTPDQAGEMLGVTIRVLERWRGSGDGPQFVRLSRKTIRYRTEDMEAFVAESCRASTAPGAGATSNR